jgi:hypothetical protein
VWCDAGMKQLAEIVPFLLLCNVRLPLSSNSFMSKIRSRSLNFGDVIQVPELHQVAELLK